MPHPELLSGCQKDKHLRPQIEPAPKPKKLQAWNISGGFVLKGRLRLTGSSAPVAYTRMHVLEAEYVGNLSVLLSVGEILHPTNPEQNDSPRTYQKSWSTMDSFRASWIWQPSAGSTA